MWNQSSRVNTKNQHHHQQSSMRKKNIRSKKLESTENEAEKYNISYIGRAMEMNMTNGLWNQGYVVATTYHNDK